MNVPVSKATLYVAGLIGYKRYEGKTLTWVIGPHAQFQKAVAMPGATPETANWWRLLGIRAGRGEEIRRRWRETLDGRPFALDAWDGLPMGFGAGFCEHCSLHHRGGLRGRRRRRAR